MLPLCAVVTALLLPVLALAHVEDAKPHGPYPAVEQPASDPVGRSGLDERLGAKIALDASFRDEIGRTRRLGELITGPTIIVPIYYRCSNVCNFLQSDLARILPEVRRTPGTDYRVLSVSIDETETPQQAAGAQKMYLSAMNTPFPKEGWRFLTGDAANIRRLTDSAGFQFQRRGVEFMHPVVSFVVAGDGTIVRYLYGTNFLSKDLTLALIEAGQGRVGKGVRKMVGYCFTFDPAQRSYQFNLLRVTATVIILCCGGFLSWLILSGRRVGRHDMGDR